MTAALLFGETLAAAMVAVMYSGGTFLESFDEGRARREMRDRLSRVPRTATRHRDGRLEEVPLDDIVLGDRLLIRQGDVVPVDGTVASPSAFLDTSALTGESLPVRLTDGGEAMSGSTNAGDAAQIAAVRPPAPKPPTSPRLPLLAIEPMRQGSSVASAGRPGCSFAYQCLWRDFLKDASRDEKQSPSGSPPSTNITPRPRELPAQVARAT